MNRKKHRISTGGEKSAEKRPFAERFGTFLDVPADLLVGGCYLEMRGQSDLRLQGCRRILVYTEEEIVLRLRRGCVRVRGRRLVCTSYHAGSVEISGWISAIDFPGTDDVKGEEA